MVEIRLEDDKQQSVFGELAFPLCLKNVSLASVEEASAWAERHLDQLDALRAKHGAILFRDFPLKNAETFDKFVSSLARNTFLETTLGGGGPRTQVRRRRAAEMLDMMHETLFFDPAFCVVGSWPHLHVH